MKHPRMTLKAVHEQASCRARRLVWIALMTCSALFAQIAHSGPYARAAAQVQADAGELQLVADPDFAAAPSDQQDATARSLCHTIANEGVTVTSVKIVTEAGTLVRVVGAATLQGC